jgi:hypothetical protein
MTTMQKIIAKLTSGKPYFCCKAFEGKTKPVFIGDVLEYIINEKGLMPLKGVELLIIWRHLGLNKSLQEIIRDCGYENVMQNGLGGKEYAKQLRLKNPIAQSLFEFINSIF